MRRGRREALKALGLLGAATALGALSTRRVEALASIPHDPFIVSKYSGVVPASVIVARDDEYAVAVDGEAKQVLVRDVNHTSVIQRAIDYVSGRGGGTVFMRYGVYTLKAVNDHALKAKSNVALLGEGTVLRGDGHVKRLLWIPPDTVNFKVLNVVFENAQERAVWISGGEDIWFVGCTFRSNVGAAIYCSDVVRRLRIMGCHISGSGIDVRFIDGIIRGNTVVDSEGGAIIFRDSQYGVVEDNYVDNCRGNGIDPSGSPDIVIRGNIVRRCGRDYTGDQEQRGITALGERSVVMGNLIEECGEYGIGVWNVGNVVVIGNVVRNCGKAGRYKYGILLHASSGYTLSNVIVVGNRCYDDQDAKTQDYGIAVQGPGTVTHVLVAYNDVEGNGVAGMNLSRTTGGSRRRFSRLQYPLTLVWRILMVQQRTFTLPAAGSRLSEESR